MALADEKDLIYALDIGTRCVVGVVGTAQEDRFKVLDIELAEHTRRAMVDGQIDNIRQVAVLAQTVTRRLEERLGVELKRVCVAAAGRALRTERGSFSLELNTGKGIDAEQISRLEAGAVSEAEQALHVEGEAENQRFFLVGYTVAQYRLDGYPLTALLDHSGQRAEVDVVATFLPSEVVESLYAAMRAAGLQVASMTLEPIAAMNAAIPAELRMLNLALVDIGAGTTDIAICKESSIVGYTMATIAGDEITEALMRTYLVDFQTAEQIKRNLKVGEICTFTDILGMEQAIPCEEIYAAIEVPMGRLAEAIAEEVLSVNGNAPSAVFLAGGGSKLDGLRKKVAKSLNIDEKRVAVAGHNFEKSAFSDTVKLDNPEYTTPLGIAVSAGMGLLNDSYVMMLNGAPAKLFQSGSLNLRDVLLMNGYTYADMLGGAGRSMSITLDGKAMTLRGEPSEPAVLLLNGTEAAISTPVQAGDRIEFTPAKKGTDAQKTLGEVIAPGFNGRVLLNGELCPMDTPLKQGDVVVTLKKPVADSVTADAPVAESPAPVQKEVVETAPVKVEAASAKEVAAPVEVKPVPMPEQEAVPLAAESAPGSAPVVEEAAAEITPPPAAAPRLLRSIHILLNEKPLTLPAKDNAQPYYLMDLLERSGIDFDHVESPVYLAINGQEAGFSHVIRDQDRVTIRCM